MLIFENIRDGTNFKEQGKAKEKECNAEKDAFEVFVFFPAYFECSCFFELVYFFENFGQGPFVGGSEKFPLGGFSDATKRTFVDRIQAWLKTSYGDCIYLYAKRFR